MIVHADSALLCDQVRQETNGKYFLIGVYSSNVVFSFFPAIAQFQLFAQMKMPERGEHKIEFRVKVGGVENQKFDAQISVEKPSRDWMPIPLQPIEFQLPGIMSVEQLDAAGVWVEFFNINIDGGPTDLSTRG